MKTNSKTGITDLLWYNGENWVSLTNQRTGEFLAVSTLKTKFGGLTPMKKFLNLEQTPPSIDRSIKAANLLKSEYQRKLILKLYFFLIYHLLSKIFV